MTLHDDSRDTRAGFADIWPIAVAAVPIGLVFGALASAKGLSPLEATLMSLLVFAGGAQFAALEIWTTPAPILLLAFSTLLINARHILMGASLAPKMKTMPLPQRLFGLYFLTDEAWALAERRALTKPISFSYWMAVAILLPGAWVGATAIGAGLGALLGDPKRFGADFAFTALFIALIAAFWKGRSTAIVIVAAGAASAIVYRTIGTPWHVVAGALAGIAAAALAQPSANSAEKNTSHDD
ncbi:MAG: branched-chain amino acid ABC transporter permease [Rhizobiales bacterium 65-9]|nr:MAG: branched-chain amino acid ABC transporter permease [Rhizobiales bacterium 65-9]